MDVCVAVTVAWLMIVKLTPYVTVAVSESIWDKILGSALELVLECLMYQCLWHFA